MFGEFVMQRQIASGVNLIILPLAGLATILTGKATDS
jgi:hypothetical protein